MESLGEAGQLGSGRFRLLRRLGAGGMGVVYEAHDRERNTRVALKTLHEAKGELLLHLKDEFRALEDLHHPNLVGLGELIAESGRWFFTMELVDGVDLLTYLRGSAEALTQTVDLETTAVVASPPTSAPRPAPPVGVAPDADRVRSVFAQLARGLHALHAAGRVHRDVKPSNVLVTPEERVVLLDFGLAAELGTRPDLPRAGTLDYMAPERIVGDAAGAAADWFSLGVMLFQALTGRLPFCVSSAAAPFERVAPPAASVEPAVPGDLAAACAALLASDPGARPSGREVLRLLGAEAAAPELTPSQTFVGRTRELEVLGTALAEVEAGACVAIVIRGESGVGKSALVRRFVGAAPPGAVVLQGRCYERASVPFKALDGIVDALSRHLQRLGDRGEALLPEDAPLLAQVFPVLGRVGALAALPRPAEPPEPLQLRRRVFAALRELLVRLGAGQPVVLVIDDLQWADDDSHALLADLLRSPGAPALLLLATERAGEARSPGPIGCARTLELANLRPDEARELAARLVERDPTPAILDRLVADTRGHPLFLSELARHVASPGGTGMDLTAALSSRVGRLDAHARELLVAVCLVGGPLSQQTAASASELDPGELRRCVSLLRAEHLVRTGGARATDAIEPYHDRVRETVVAGLDDARRSACHARLADALETAGVEAALLAQHCLGSGQQARAQRHAVRAASEAVRALAFDRAAQLFQVALDLGPSSADEAQTLRVGLADALAHAGRGAPAAAEYLRAAEGAAPPVALALRRHAATHLLCSGHVDHGVDVVRGVLSQLGVRWAESPTRALLALLWGRARLALRGLGHRVRLHAEIPAAARERLDALAGVVEGLCLVDHIRSTAYHARYLRAALDLGEPAHLARALSQEAGFQSMQGPRGLARARRVLAEVEALVEQHGGDAYAHARCVGIAGILAYNDGRFSDCLRLCDEAERLFRDRCTNVSWELSTAHVFALGTLGHLGHLAEIARRLPVLLAEAQDRGDRYAATFFRTIAGFWLHLAADDVASARRDLDEALASWSPRGFHFVHFWAMCSHVHIALYDGDGRAAWAGLEATWPALERSFLLRPPPMRAWAVWARSRAALGAVAAGAPARLLRTVDRDARWLSRQSACFVGLARVLEAGAAALRGRQTAVAPLLAEAEPLLEAAGMTLHAACVRWHRGRLHGDTDGTEAAAARITAMGARHPERIVRQLAPGV